MADVIQAAKWMKEGKQVKTKALVFPVYMPNDGSIKMMLNSGPRGYALDVEDILSKDWEVAE